MKNLLRWLIVACCLSTAWPLLSADSPREHLSLDPNWKFHLGDDWPDVLRLDKAGVADGPASRNFDDAAWRTVQLPHDWAIELPFDPAADVNHGFKPVGPKFTATSVGWYRRTFELPAADANKRIWLQFDGSFRDTTVWVNGWLVKHFESGYYPFRADITDVAKFGDKNIISVKVNASRFEGWFYEGAGLYRHVWLDKTAPVAIAPDGIFVSSSFQDNVPDGDVALHAQVRLINHQDAPVQAKVTYAFHAPDGSTVRELTDVVKLRAGAQKEFSTDADGLHCTLGTYELWSPESPRLYRLVTTVEVGGVVTDHQETEFGIRTVAFDRDKGFLLNGKHYELYGTCNHQDHAGVGAALPDALQDFRIKQLKEFGCNAYRTSHNPPTPELLTACDHLGMIVMDENRLLGSDENNLQLWETEIRRDRNHPSVCIWSICNEESTQTQPVSAKVGATMQALVKSLDPTRPVTAAESTGDVYTGLPGALEVRGWNYNAGEAMDNYHKEHPAQPNVGTEDGSNRATRGIYQTDARRGYVSARQLAIEKWWQIFAARPWLSGAFIWTGFDYRGEPSPYRWPCISSHFGLLDTCGFPKDDAYYFQSCWTTKPMVHLLPHWNWAGQEGQEIEVDAFSNCQEVELFLNGQTLGRQPMPPNGHLSWQVKYAAGTLSAKGYNEHNAVVTTEVATTGEPAAIGLQPDRSAIKADGEDLSLFTVSVKDAQGRVVPTASNLVHFALNGPGKIIGVGNGDPSCHEPDTALTQPPVRLEPIAGWRWHESELPKKGVNPPEADAKFDDAAWHVGTEDVQPGAHVFFRARFNVTPEDLAKPGLQIRFSNLGDVGTVYVNGQRADGFTTWGPQPPVQVKKFLHAGENVVAVGLAKESAQGGLDPRVNLEVIGQPVPGSWSRSVFNGLAQVIVQSTGEPGEIQLTATADGINQAMGAVQTQPSAPRPSLP